MIYQHSPSGKLLAEYQSVLHAAIGINADESTIRKALNTGKLAKEFIWTNAIKDGKVELPKVLILDIETAPISAYVWSLKTKYVNPEMIIQNSFCLTVAAKWLYEDKTVSDKLTSGEAISCDDRRLMNTAWKLLDEADIVIAHNGINFDIKKLQGRFFLHGMPPTSSFQQIDTLRVARKEFLLDSNKLNEINKQLSVERKMDTGGMTLWTRCLCGSPEALAKMEEYNRQDVNILEDTYFAIRSWVKSHPGYGVYINSIEPCCATCGSQDILRVGSYKTGVSSFPEYRCSVCGSLFRGRTNEITKEVRENLLIGEAR